MFLETFVPLTALVLPLGAMVVAAALTPVARRLAIRAGMVAQPKMDRWHKAPTAMLGGTAIVATVLLLYAPSHSSMPHDPRSWIILPASVFLFAIGLIDDIIGIKPYQKLIGQVMGASLVVFVGLALPWTPWATINIAITIFWLVGITNAINLLDNMDGLAAGVSAIAASFLAVTFLLSGQPAEALLLGVFAGALFGFLIHNSHPASIFMGDCGSMFIGFFLAGATLLSASGARPGRFVVVLAVPVLVLLIPIFDTTLVTLLRKLAGRAASQGGRDHTSHRLVALGLSEQHAVWLLYGLAAASGLLAVLVNHLDPAVSIPLMAGFAIALALLGVYLAGVAVYDPAEIQLARERSLVAFLVDVSHKRRLFEVLLDLVLVILSFYTASILVHGTLARSGGWDPFLRSVSVILFVRMFAFLATGSYRGIWRYISLDNVVAYAQAVVAGTLASVTILFFGFDIVIPPAVLVLDAMILFFAVTGSRVTFRMFRRALPGRAPLGLRRALIFGAGDAGALALREIRYNRALRLTPVGFIDDDPLKIGKRIHGLPVFPGNGSLRRHGAEELLISTANLTDERLLEISRDCKAAGINVRRMRLQLEPLDPPKTSREAPRDVPREVPRATDFTPGRANPGAEIVA